MGKVAVVLEGWLYLEYDEELHSYKLFKKKLTRDDLRVNEFGLEMAKRGIIPMERLEKRVREVLEEGKIYWLDVEPEGVDYELLEAYLNKFLGKRVRITIEVIE